MSDTTPKDQPPQPLGFPEPVEVQARTRTRRKKPGKAPDNVIPMQSPEDNPFPRLRNNEMFEVVNHLTEMMNEAIKEINERLSRCTCSKKP